MINAIDLEMPSVAEVLGGQTQGGVPRPAVLDRDDEPMPTAADIANQVKQARAEVEAARSAYTAAGKRLGSAQDALLAVENAFAKAVETEFFA